MTGATARKPRQSRSVSRVQQTSLAMQRFRRAYADAVIPDMTDAQFCEAVRVRQLTWKCKYRLPLADAVECYDQMAGSYNEFHAGLVRALHCAFRDDGIQATPAREMSVAIYLHVPNTGDLRSRVASFCCEHFNADDVDWTEDGILRCWWD